LKGAIKFENVAFGYSKDAPVLTNVNFEIKAGQMVGVVGPTGSGKSTIVSLIPRFYDPSGGKVSVDGVDLREYRLHGLRSQIAYVLQETVLFRGTVAENIAYGRGSATRDEIIQAAQLANADEFIVKMPQGYDTMVGDRGDTLSGGQRQRIRIAPALIRNNPILILDEPTAALDTESEKLDGGSRAADEGPHGDHYRPPIEHDSQFGQDCGAERRRCVGSGYPRRIDGQGRRIRGVVSHTIRQTAWGRRRIAGQRAGRHRSCELKSREAVPEARHLQQVR
jgi:ABC-type Mn2+/Zn2+ transport system ATPase subunit